MSELEYISWLRSTTPATSQVLVGPGDDAAAIAWERDIPCLITTDMLLEGTCFVLQEAGPQRVGRKAMAVNLSDIAAMAGKPIAAVVSVALSRSQNDQLAKELYVGMREMGDAFGTSIVGGDTNSWDGPLAICVTLIGEPTGAGPARRSGAEPGDWLFVTGPLGGSIRGRHLTFTPRVREAQQLHQLVRLKAMIDISDGLAADLNHICEESGCGAVVREHAVPIADDARSLSDGRLPLDHALGDGEDFELLFAVSPADGERLLTAQPLQTLGGTLYHVGECVSNGLWRETADGSRRALEPFGYVHSFGNSALNTNRR